MLEFELQIAEQLAKTAGQKALELQHLGVLKYKDNAEGPVTLGDLEADRILREGLQAHFPKDLIITEESFDNPSLPISSKGRVWFVDPIDGTLNYAAQGSEYAVMIGLAIDGVPQMGVVYQPATHTLWRSKPTLAERLSPEAQIQILDIHPKTVPKEGPVLVLSHSHPSALIDFLVSKLPISKIIQKSSVGLKITLVADGEADIFICSAKHIKLWDTCAPAAILSASGGSLKAISGAPLVFGDNIQHGIEIIATTPHAELWLSNRIQGVIEEWITLRKTRKHSS